MFVSNRDGPRDLFAVRVRSSGEAAGDPVSLSAGLEMHTVSAADDGRTLAFSVFRQASNIWALDISTGGPRRFSDATRITSGRQTVEGLDLSPDGQWLAFDANRTGTQDIYVVPASGGEAERVISSAVDKFHPAWSPDGKAIAFHTFQGGVRRAAIAPARGGPVQFVHPHPDGSVEEEHTPVWMRDGQGLVFFRIFVGGSDLYLVRRTSDSMPPAPAHLARRCG
jgi:TolB protein